MHPKAKEGLQNGIKNIKFAREINLIISRG
jgi:hypothetical protein